jgi:hypothetical protein
MKPFFVAKKKAHFNEKKGRAKVYVYQKKEI